MKYEKAEKISPLGQIAYFYRLKGAGGAADLKINKAARLCLNHHIFSNTEQIYIK